MRICCILCIYAGDIVNRVLVCEKWAILECSSLFRVFLGFLGEGKMKRRQIKVSDEIS